MRRRLSEIYGEGEGEGEGCTFLMWAFHFCWPIRTLTVLDMRPAETTTAFICREAEAASFWVDISARCGNGWEGLGDWSWAGELLVMIETTF